MTIYTLFGLIAAIALGINLIRLFAAPPASKFVAYVQDFVGVLFIFSGFVKAIDPLGTAYKMTEYFHEFNMMFMDDFALSFAVFMIVLEFVLGFALLLGYQKNITINLLLLTIVFFTFLTGYTAITDKVTDCGCFGDFIKLKPIQSFYKDIFLTVLILILLWKKNSLEPLMSKFPSLVLLVLITLSTTAYCFNNFYFNIPQFDFRPYKVGNYIPDLMTVPEDRKPIKDFVFVYKNKKSGEIQEFKVDELGNVTDEFEFVDRKEIVIREGELPKINNFRVDNENGEDISDELLNDSNYAFWIIAYDLNNTHLQAFETSLENIASKAKNNGYRIFAVSSSNPSVLKENIKPSYPFYGGDATFLKTIIRSNPGLVIVKNGTVMAKYHYKHLPTYETIQAEVLK